MFMKYLSNVVAALTTSLTISGCAHDMGDWFPRLPPAIGNYFDAEKNGTITKNHIENINGCPAQVWKGTEPKMMEEPALTYVRQDIVCPDRKIEVIYRIDLNDDNSYDLRCHARGQIEKGETSKDALTRLKEGEKSCKRVMFGGSLNGFLE